MVIASSGSKNAIYGALILATILIAIDIWYVTNVLQLRQVGYLLWEGGLSILLLLIGLLMSYKFSPDERTRKGITISYLLLIFGVLVSLNYATLMTQIDKLTFYMHLQVTMSVILLIGMIGNLVGIEKKTEEGFNINVYSKDSPIPPRLLIPTWLLVFFIMGAFVFVTGSVLISYPQFGIMEWLGGPMVSGFSVGDAENITFMILPFALAMLVLRYFKIQPIPSILISLIIGTVCFTFYHSLVYSTNTVAMLMVLIFGVISLSIYSYTKSIVILSAIHISNNFWGSIFVVSVIGLSAFGGSPIPAIWASIILIIGSSLAVFVILKLVKKE